jgi:hypothetical protein
VKIHVHPHSRTRRDKKGVHPMFEPGMDAYLIICLTAGKNIQAQGAALLRFLRGTRWPP